MHNEQQKTSCRRSAKHGWKHYLVGVGILGQISGKKAFAISRNSQSKRGIPKFLAITKRQVDIESVSGLVFSEQAKETCHLSAKHGWKYYPVGVGILGQICGKKDFAISRNSQTVRGIVCPLRYTKR